MEYGARLERLGVISEIKKKKKSLFHVLVSVRKRGFK